jgi:putative tricarboxylic transport membrane protein
VVLVLCVIGGYAPDQRMHDVYMIVLFGAGAFVLRKCDYPLAPLVLALVLGPLMERSFRQSLILSQGDFTTFVTRPISGVLMAIALALFLWPLVTALRSRRRAAAQPAE